MNEKIIKFKVIDSTVDVESELNVSQEILDLIYKINTKNPMSYSRVIGELEIAKHSLLKSFFNE